MKEEGLPFKAYHTGGVLTFKNQGEVAIALGNAPAAHTHLLAAGATDVTASAAQVNAIAALVRKDIKLSRLYASDGTTLKSLSWSLVNGNMQVAGQQADGDRLQVFIFASGTETKLSLTHLSGTVDGKWDLYINGVKDGATTYDNYAASVTETNRTITLTEAIVAGYNLIEFRVNGKNASSTSYYFRFLGGSVY